MERLPMAGINGSKGSPNRPNASKGNKQGTRTELKTVATLFTSPFPAKGANRTKTAPYWLNELDLNLIMRGFESLSLVLDDLKNRREFQRMEIVVRRLGIDPFEPI
jgi:hypothetical protein